MLKKKAFGTRRVNKDRKGTKVKTIIDCCIDFLMQQSPKMTIQKRLRGYMNILFVCTGNTCRSAMAAAIMDKLAQKRRLDIRIESAGIFASSGESASKNAIEALKKYDIDLSYHRSKPVTDDLIKQCDLILTMTTSHKQVLEPVAGDKTFTLSEYVGAAGDISDPYGGNLEIYEKTAGELYELLNTLADKLSEEK